MNLTELANKYGSDKGTSSGYAHGYTPLYEMMLGPHRTSLKRMLEIGLLIGGPELGFDQTRSTGDLPSIKMWLDYFPNAVIHGFDISDFSFFKNDRFIFTQGDAGSENNLDRVKELDVEFDFIIDDGSHASFHQQLAFMKFFPLLRTGGFYIIEDLHWQSPHYEKKLPPTFTTAKMFDSWFQTGRFPVARNGRLQANDALADEISYAFTVDERGSKKKTPKTVIMQKK